MSSYSSVVPVDWIRLWNDVLPAWLSVLSGSMDPSLFYAKYVPEGDPYGDLLDERYIAPPDYLSLFGKPLSPPYSRHALHDSGKCADFLATADLSASPYLLTAAIEQTAAVKLSEDDPHASNFFASIRTPSDLKQAAGTKNLYAFLEAAFDVRWNAPKHHFNYSRRQDSGSSAQLHELLEALFLYQCGLPGAWFPLESPTWPGYDDLSFAGYLSPIQVEHLRDELAAWDAAPHANPLFALFLERVQRSSDSGLGLITIHAIA
jgi:hypothetical protein